MNKLILSLAISAISLGVTASETAANGPAWNYVDLGYVQGDIDGVDADPTGFGVGASFLVSDSVFFTAGYTSVSEDVVIFGYDVDAEINQATFGIGYRLPISETTDFHVGANYLNLEACASIPGFGGDCMDENGYGLNLGIRSMLTNQFEFFAGAGYVDIDSESETSTTLGVAYNFTDTFAVKLGWSTTGDIDLLGLSGRFEF